MKTISKFVPATITARECYTLSLSIISYHKRLFLVNNHLCFKAFALPTKGFFQLVGNFTLRDHENLEKSRRRRFLLLYFITVSSTDTPNADTAPQIAFLKLLNNSSGRSRLSSIVQGFLAFGFADIRLFSPFNQSIISDEIMGHTGRDDSKALSIP